MNLLTPSQSMFRSVNPATGETFGAYRLHDGVEIESALARSSAAWRTITAAGVERRAQLLLSLADRLEANLENLARLMTLEMGKPINEARGEIRKCAATCRTTAELGPGWLEPLEVPSPARASRVRYEGLGPILAIMPWNFPFWQVVRFFAPAFLAGNTTIVKHAENVPACAEGLEKVFADAGMPDGVLVNLRVDHPTVATLIADPRIRSVTVTGSVRAGRTIAGIAGAAGKKAVLELGGSDPFIVFADADFSAAVKTAVASRHNNSGQSCVCAKRFLVEQSIAADFTEAFVEATRKLAYGDPLDEKNAIGPLARADLRAGLQDQLDRSVAGGARMALAGGSVAGAGYFFAPTVLTNVVDDNVAAREELFGPVAPILPFADEAEALRIANGTEFGLASAVWTRDEDRARRMEAGIEAGAVFINDMVRSDAHISFGGIKASGYGRELGKVGIHEFTNAKTVWVG
ncbi:MAG: yneI [Devosia sp.]|uniref:NAD-dependent succinate-semialdehyde dehydrogenase n=1 Tax=Devosia sp. TaxID=1871048 RepID=UPI002638AE4E|nr:NAD-dependent succinate-semialdehyde dehydrogenase [Devosia sp.]MDB5542121.1 yneI [Devosia sp.]